MDPQRRRLGWSRYGRMVIAVRSDEWGRLHTVGVVVASWVGGAVIVLIICALSETVFVQLLWGRAGVCSLPDLVYQRCSGR